MMERGKESDTFIVIPLRDAVGFIIKGLPLAILFAAMGVVAVWLLAQQRPASFTTVAYLLSVRQELAPTVVRGLIPGSLDPSLYRAAVSNGPVLAAVRANWTGVTPLPDDSDILSNLRVISDNMIQSSVVRVEYRTDDPADAAAIANAVARELIVWDQARTLRPMQEWSERLQAELSALDTEIDQNAEPALDLLLARAQRYSDLAQLQSTLPLSQLSLLSEADVPTEHDSQGLVSGAALAIAVGVMVAYLLRLTRIVLMPPAKMPGEWLLQHSS